MLTTDDARDYLESLGVELPDAVLTLLVNRVNTISSCLGEHYDPDVAALIGLYLVALLGAANGARMISSQSAPSGASRSFAYRTMGEMWTGISGLLRALDTHGCTNDLVPDDPTVSAHGGVWIGVGGQMCR